MSSDFYIKWWVLTKKQLVELQKYDAFMRASTKKKSVRDRVQASSLVSGLYCKYCMIVQDIDECLDQICQPQKAITIRKLMDAAVIRLDELKEMLKEIDLSEIHYVDGALMELKLVPYNIEILDPALLYPRLDNIQEMWEKIQKGERLFDRPEESGLPLTADEIELLLHPKEPEAAQEPAPTEGAPPVEANPPAEGVPPAEGAPPAEGTLPAAEGTTPSEAQDDEQEPEKKPKRKAKRPVKKFVPEKKELTEEEIQALKHKEMMTNTVKMIQTHERARQCRLYVSDLTASKKRKRSEKKQEISPDIQNSAATAIQKMWKGKASRNFMKFQEDRRRLVIGMTEPSWKSKEEFIKRKNTVDMRRQLVRQKAREYVQALIDEKNRVLRVVAPGLMEDIGDEIREWFYQWYIRAKNFDKYPSAEKGGSILIVRCETFTPEEWLDEVERKRRDKVKGRGKNKAKEKAEKKKKEMEAKRKAAQRKKKEAQERKRKEKSMEFDFKFGDSPGDAKMADAFKEYKKLWGERKMVDNPKDELYMDMITEQKCYEVQLECRSKVDELMRLELELLVAALAYDKAKAKHKKPKKKKKKKKKKKRKKKKKKGKKDITAKRTTEDLFQELVDAGVIHTYPETHLEEFRGDMSYNNWEKRLQDYNPPPALGDVRQVVSLTCILPLGVETMVRPKSVLIIGPKNSGKHLLANAVFTETKSVLFDLSAPILAGKYQGAGGKKMLVHLINKMSRLLQPSVIFFDGAEKPFYKRIPKQEKELEPKKLGKQLYKKIVKTIKPEDRVLVLGISAQPWAGKAKGLKKTYERVILIPRTDYGSIYLYWRELLMPYHGVDRDLNVSCLTRLSVHYPLNQLKEIVQSVLTPRRIIQLHYNPLRHIELYTLLISPQYGPVTDKQYKKFAKFYNKTKLGKKKAKYMKVADAKRAQEAKALSKQRRR